MQLVTRPELYYKLEDDQLLMQLVTRHELRDKTRR